MDAIVPPLAFVGPPNVQVLQDIAYWIWTHKMYLGLRWLAASLLFAAFWILVMAIAGHERDDD
jgi:hypothetical protein